MAPQHSLSLLTAILININIMVGVGIFINTALLAKGAGALGFLSYALIGILLLPLILSIATLLKMHPSGGFYIFGRREINPFFGFFSAWAYFTGKLASVAIMIHTSVLILQQFFVGISTMNPLIIDFIILTLFISLNLLNLKAGSRIQKTFTTLKITTVLFAIIGGLYLFKGSNFSAPHLIWTGIPATLPLVLYATMGFESACSLSSKIHNAQRNAPIAIFTSYGIVILITILYQLAFYGALGSSLTELTSYREAFPNLAQQLLPANVSLAVKVGSLLNLAIVSSALGSAYGLLFSNTWNLYAVAQHQHILFSSFFTQLNKQFVPFACVIAEGVICALYLLISQGNQVPLQQTGALAATLAYTISVIALLIAKINRPALPTNILIPIFALINCGLLIMACVAGLIKTGISSLYGFSILLIVGIVMFYVTPGRAMEEPTESLK